jgi:hypothetical protein
VGVRADLTIGDYWEGILDEAGIWYGTALSDANVLALYNSGNGRRFSELAAAGIPAPTYYWSLDQNAAGGATAAAAGEVTLTDVGTADAQGIPAGQL